MTEELITLEVTFVKRGKPVNPEKLANAVHSAIADAMWHPDPDTLDARIDPAILTLDGVIVSSTGFRSS